MRKLPQTLLWNNKLSQIIHTIKTIYNNNDVNKIQYLEHLLFNNKPDFLKEDFIKETFYQKIFLSKPKRDNYNKIFWPPFRQILESNYKDALIIQNAIKHQKLEIGDLLTKDLNGDNLYELIKKTYGDISFETLNDIKNISPRNLFAQPNGIAEILLMLFVKDAHPGSDIKINDIDIELKGSDARWGTPISYSKKEMNNFFYELTEKNNIDLSGLRTIDSLMKYYNLIYDNENHIIEFCYLIAKLVKVKDYTYYHEYNDLLFNLKTELNKIFIKAFKQYVGNSHFFIINNKGKFYLISPNEIDNYVSAGFIDNPKPISLYLTLDNNMQSFMKVGIKNKPLK